jgi:chromosome partitioning protein
MVARNMALKIITLLAQKGGCGKTTLATNLAVASVCNGFKTLIIDLDNQKTATHWWESRDANDPLLVHPSYNEFDKALQLARGGEFQTVLIDTAGRDDLMNTKASAVADFCLLPCQPTMEDMRAQNATVDLIRRQQKPAAFVLTRCGIHLSRIESAKKGLAVYGLPVAPSHLVNRTAYPDAYVMSKGVVEHDPDGKASTEISSLWSWLSLKMEKLIV